ncbi:MAG TPA: DUF6391 domain-containing protein [Halanaerobiales bacterium]|nr:DUF6391 domain-containing protein [Halanaerobiales bacterium]
MFMLLLLFILFLFSPYLLLPFAAFFIFLLLLLPFKFTFDSIFRLFTIPSQIYKIATNPELRKNHALEHATANVLDRNYGYQNLAGYADEGGFFIIGTQDSLMVEQAAREGLALLKAGEEELAIHGKCGTSITVANFISALIFIILILSTGYFSLINMVLAILIANLAGPLLGKYVQKYFTTSADVEEMEIVSTNFAGGNHWRAPAKIFVKTTRIPYLNR